jgi:hypothetical protein
MLRLPFILLFIFALNLCANDLQDFKNALNKDQYEDAFDIYIQKINGDDTKAYQNYLFSTVIKKLKRDTEQAESLLQEYLDIQYNDPMGLYMMSEIKLVQDNYDEALHILYQLKSSYLDEGLSTKVDSKLSSVVDTYLNLLSKENNMGKLDEVVYQFYSNNDAKSLGKWQKILIDIASTNNNEHNYTTTFDLISKLESYEMDESVEGEFNNLIKNFQKLIKDKKLKGFVE